MLTKPFSDSLYSFVSVRFWRKFSALFIFFNFIFLLLMNIMMFSWTSIENEFLKCLFLLRVFFCEAQDAWNVIPYSTSVIWALLLAYQTHLSNGDYLIDRWEKIISTCVIQEVKYISWFRPMSIILVFAWRHSWLWNTDVLLNDL